MSNRRSTQSNPAGVIATEIAHVGENVTSVAKAAGITTGDLQAFLSGDADLTVAQMVRAGGFLRLTPREMLGVAP